MLPEAEAIAAQLRKIRSEISELLGGLNDEALNWKPAPGANSIYAIATHIPESEQHWIASTVGRANLARDRDAEFRAAGSDVERIRTRMDEVAQQTESVLETLTEADLAGERDMEGKVRSVRYCLLFAIEHMATHLGHLQLTRQLWETRQRTGIH